MNVLAIEVTVDFHVLANEVNGLTLKLTGYFATHMKARGVR